MEKRYRVTLLASERDELRKLVSVGKSAAQKLVRARILLQAEAHLIALACSAPPEGRARWTLRLLSDRMVVLEHGASVSYETVRRVLKKTSSSRG